MLASSISHKQPTMDRTLARPMRAGRAAARKGLRNLGILGFDVAWCNWRGDFVMSQKNGALARWLRARTENARGTRKLMIVALARKLLIGWCKRAWCRTASFSPGDH
jgi:hypothetical protein